MNALIVVHLCKNCKTNITNIPTDSTKCEECDTPIKEENTIVMEYYDDEYI